MTSSEMPRRHDGKADEQMRTGFGHFDSSHRENFCAAILLFVMDFDEGARDLIARSVRHELGIDALTPMLGFGREARLSKTDDSEYARVDLWLSFETAEGSAYAFVEVKTRSDWAPGHVASQVRDQTRRPLARSSRRILGSILLAPPQLCRLVQAEDSAIRCLPWPRLLHELATQTSASPLTLHALHHLKEQMENPPGLDRPLTLAQFEEATTTVACLRQFLVETIASIQGSVHGEPLFLTPGDGRPRRSGAWAWHGLSVPFKLNSQSGRMGIYKYSDSPPGDSAAKDSLWLEVYLGDSNEPVAFVPFAPPTLSSEQLVAVRASLVATWPK